MSSEAFWERVGAYNEATRPIMVLMMVIAVFLTVRVFVMPGSRTDAWMKAFLAFAFAWNGVVFFLVFMRNPISTFTGVPLFLLVSLLFALDNRGGKTRFGRLRRLGGAE